MKLSPYLAWVMRIHAGVEDWSYGMTIIVIPGEAARWHVRAVSVSPVPLDQRRSPTWWRHHIPDIAMYTARSFAACEDWGLSA